MKRVVGLPGETVSIEKHELHIDGLRAERPGSLSFLKYYGYGNTFRGKSFQCEDGFYVLGDSSIDSYDSRFEGTLAADRINGRPWLRVWPWERIGFVNP
jgi:signal peptidase I